jgi:hypothetical protein
MKSSPLITLFRIGKKNENANDSIKDAKKVKKNNKYIFLPTNSLI